MGAGSVVGAGATMGTGAVAGLLIPRSSSTCFNNSRRSGSTPLSRDNGVESSAWEECKSWGLHMKGKKKHEPSGVAALDIPIMETHSPLSCSNCARNREIGGRLGRIDSCSQYQDCSSSPHSTSENPTAGRSGRPPSITCM